ncbi:MAG: SPOR domain-containing protein [Aquabacterium sp.]|uniref:SPOR domain-containing protein n=1 Tax=Aquabacterium sp. TaxID=1872578 RepID=UPI002727650A|nr:SPOR domain-containing protein [Aquabacterium sp.]MDO9005916.1 SPOR domain-containing protein [Aquabacterium sp.]
MLRSLVLVLLLANAGFYAWSHGWLNDIIGLQPDAQREPQRLKRQVNADQLTVVGASSVAPASSSSSAPPSQTDPASSAPVTEASAGRTICVEAGPFTAAEQPQVEATLKPVLAANSWTTDTVAVPGVWLTYMGPYADADVLARKLTELRRIRGLNFEEVKTPANLAPGLSLGRYTRLEDANAALNTLKLRGIRTARVVTLRPAMEVQVVRVAQADINTQVALSTLKLPQGKSFAACRP